MWICQCDCGNQIKVRGYSLRSRHTESCGCYHLEKAAEAGKQNRKHGKSGTAEYMIWSAVKARCYNSSNTAYEHYGGRGIKVCERWHKFENFYADMGKRPSPRHSIERVDNNGDYEPDNCHWATQREQVNNRRNNRIVEYDGKSHTVAEWARIKGMNRYTLYNRLFTYKWPVERALTEPVRSVK